MGNSNGMKKRTGLRRLGPWIPHLGAVLITGACFVDGALIYGSLPDTVPVHWGLDGPDAWGEKSVGTVFMGPFVALGTAALLALVSAAAPALSQQEPGASRWEAFRREGMIRGTVAAMGTVSLLVAACVGYLAAQSWRTPEQVALWPALVLSAGVLAVVIPVYAAANRNTRREAARRGIHPSEEEKAEDAKWIGGILLNDARNPRVLVPKREGTGTGLTVNVGNARGRTAVALFLVVLIVLPVGLGILSGP
ncbi:MAG: DUF1648 domain-containing protein [Arthrobacter sp.]